MKSLLPPYRGKDPYIFLSYAHKNMDAALEFINRLQQDGYRIWYDEGIDPGTEWDENIAYHVEQCSFFISLLSEEYLASSNCKDEINYARDLDKPRILVYLSEVTLPGGMHMRLSRLQAIHKYKYKNEELFYQKLYESPEIEKCSNSGDDELCSNEKIEIEGFDEATSRFIVENESKIALRGEKAFLDHLKLSYYINLDRDGLIRWVSLEENNETVFLQKINNPSNAADYMKQMRYIESLYTGFFRLYFGKKCYKRDEQFFKRATPTIKSNKANCVLIGSKRDNLFSWIGVLDDYNNEILLIQKVFNNEDIECYNKQIEYMEFLYPDLMSDHNNYIELTNDYFESV